MQRDSHSRNILFALASQMGPAVLTAGLTLYLVRALGPSGYGVFAVAVGFSGLLLLPADFGVSQSAARFIAERRGDREAVAAIMTDALALKLAVTALLAALMVALAAPIADLYDTPGLEWPLRILAIALIGQSFTLLFAYTFVALGRLSFQFRLLFYESVMEVAASVLLVALAGGASAAAAGRAVGYIAAAALGAFLAVRLLGLAAVRRRRRTVARRELAGYAGTMLVVDGSYSMFQALPILVVGAQLGSTAAGAFSAPAKLTASLSYPGLAVANAVAPGVARGADAPTSGETIARAMRWLVLLYAPIAVYMLVWAEPITNLLLGPDFADSVDVMRALSPYVFVGGFGPLMALSVNYLGKARRRIPIVVASVLLNLVLLLVLLPAIGVAGAAISLSAAFTFYVAGHMTICTDLLEIHLGRLLIPLLRSLLASAALAALLALIGTGEIGVVGWGLGVLLGPLVYLVALLAARELTVGELRMTIAVVRKRLVSRSASEPLGDRL